MFPRTMPLWNEVPIHVLDFEGSTRTGVVEYGVATLHGGEITATATRLCRPIAPVPRIDTQCHGLSDADLAGAAPLAEDWDFFSGWRRSGLFAAHHAPTEHGLLKTAWPYPGAMPDHARANGAAVNDWGPWIDTCRLSAQWCPRLSAHKLGVLVEWFRLEKKLAGLARLHCPPARCRYHCALYDALAGALLLRHLCAQPERIGITLEELVRGSLGGSRHSERIQGEMDFLW